MWYKSSNRGFICFMEWTVSQCQLLCWQLFLFEFSYLLIWIILVKIQHLKHEWRAKYKLYCPQYTQKHIVTFFKAFSPKNKSSSFKKYLVHTPSQWKTPPKSTPYRNLFNQQKKTMQFFSSMFNEDVEVCDFQPQSKKSSSKIHVVETAKQTEDYRIWICRFSRR